MAKPLVAIVGRPNVGKSMLFNKLTGQRTAIVEDTPGVTRDRIFADATWCGYAFTMVDTGGLELKSEDVMWKEIAKDLVALYAARQEKQGFVQFLRMLKTHFGKRKFIVKYAFFT